MRVNAPTLLSLLILSGVKDSCSWTYWPWTTSGSSAETSWSTEWSRETTADTAEISTTDSTETTMTSDDLSSVTLGATTAASDETASAISGWSTSQTTTDWITTASVGADTTSATSDWPTSQTTTAWITTTTTTQPPTTPPSAPKLYPALYVSTTLNTAMNASDTISSLCSNYIASDFRSSFQDIVSRMNSAIANRLLCTDSGRAITVMPGQIQNFFIGNQVQTEFNVMVGTNPSDSVTIGMDESCSWEASQFVQNSSNWRQPIISNIFGCPAVDITPPGFTWKSSQWGCF